VSPLGERWEPMEDDRPAAEAAPPDPDHPTLGVVQGVGAFLWWGIVTSCYFKWLDRVSPWELLAWRVLGGLPVLLLILAFRRDLASLGVAFRDRATRRTLLLSTLLISANWFCFIIAVVTERLREGSLGFLINPLISVLLGVFILGERLRTPQAVAVGLAAVGVSLLTWSQGALPVLALILATVSAVYGLLRKRMPAGPTTGLCLEMLALFPAMLALQVYLTVRGETLFLRDAEVTFGLFVGGVVTIVPLVLFASSARRLRLSTVGLLQYISPTAQLLLAVLAFGEEFTRWHAISFSIIWVAAGLYTFDSVRHAPRR
jgi:chloramphenicol-sensitive protein RarD